MNKSDSNYQPSIHIGSDIPKSDPSGDELGYAPFAKLIALSVEKTPSPQGLVMAIYGQWGLGKTSLLNFVKHYLNEGPKDSKPVVIDFNPWWFDDKDQLAAQFLAQFKSKLKLENEYLRKAGDLMADYSGALGKAVAVGTGVSWIDVPVGWLLKLFKRKPKDVPKLKAEISKALQDGGRRFLVVIDDIDRLTPREIREVFKVIKALADFPNVVYILSFDRAVVAQALSQSMLLDGEAYLEKIIQVSFVLPAIARGKLQRKLFADLNKLIEGADVALFNQTYWGNIFVDGMAQLLTKPRDIVRYVNALSVTFPSLRDEVNIPDFFALEFLRVNLPSLYNTIRENPERFTGCVNQGIRSSGRKEESEFHQVWAIGLDERIRPGIQSMMERIFPRLDNMGRGNEFLSTWRKHRRAASPDIFPNYFRFAIDTEGLSRQTITAFVDGLTDQDKSREILLNAINVKRMDGTSKAKDYLDNLLDFETEIDASRAVNLLKIIGQIADKLILRRDEENGLFSMSSSWRILWVLRHALTRIPEDDRDAQLITAFEDGQALAFLCHSILAIHSAQEKPVEYGPSVVLTNIKLETVENLKQLALVRIRAAATANTLIDTPELPSVLIRWRDWGLREEPRQWAESITAEKRSLIRFLSKFLSQSRSTTMGDTVGRIRHTLHFKLVSDFIDLERAAKLLGQFGKDDAMDEEDDLVISTFNVQYELFKHGKNPDGPFFGLDNSQD